MEEQHKSKIAWVLFAIITALIGVIIYQYYLANNLEKETAVKTVATKTTTNVSTTPTAVVSATPTVTATSAENSDLSVKKVVDQYISTDFDLLPKIEGVEKLDRSVEKNNQIDEYESPLMQSLRTSELNTYLLCLVNKSQEYTNEHPYEMVLNAHLLFGIQAYPPEYSIDSTEKINNEEYKVNTTFTFNTPLTIIFDLKKVGNKWLIDSTNRMASSDKLDCAKQ